MVSPYAFLTFFIVIGLVKTVHLFSLVLALAHNIFSRFLEMQPSCVL